MKVCFRICALGHGLRAYALMHVALHAYGNVGAFDMQTAPYNGGPPDVGYLLQQPQQQQLPPQQQQKQQQQQQPPQQQQLYGGAYDSGAYGGGPQTVPAQGGGYLKQEAAPFATAPQYAPRGLPVGPADPALQQVRALSYPPSSPHTHTPHM